MACLISLQADIVARLEKAKSGDEPFSATASNSNGANNGASTNNGPGSSGSSASGSSGNAADNAVATPPAESAGGAATGGVSAADLDSLSVRDLRTMVRRGVCVLAHVPFVSNRLLFLYASSVHTLICCIHRPLLSHVFTLNLYL